jgi:Tfp pilus assembly protein PilF
MARSYGNVGIHLAEQGKFDEARPYFQRSLEIQTRAHGPAHPSVAQGWMNLGLLSLQSGNARGAVGELQHALDIRHEIGDTTSPSYSLNLYHMASARMALGDAAGARTFMLRVITLDEKLLGPDSKSVADDLEGLVEIERTLGHRTEADRAEARMNAILKALGPAAAE